MPTRQPPAPQITAFEQHMQSFLARRGTDVDAQAAVFNIERGGIEVIATLEALALRPLELTHAGFVVLMTLWITGPRETRELASVLRVTKGAVVGAVNTLERRGLVRRVRSDVDRRLVTYELTPEGDALVVRAQKDWRELEVAVTSSLTVEEKRILAALCRRMADAAKELRRKGGLASPRLPDPAAFLHQAATSTNGRRPAARRKRHATASH
jgi:DNA-binding MarR family transcriptional regulator